MPYRFKARESVPDGIRRIVREEIEDATKQLSKITTRTTGPKALKRTSSARLRPVRSKAKTAKRDEAIHETRKSIKKIRAVVRLMQPELGQAYRKENQRLGETGRRLSELRDAEAIIEVFDGVADKYRDQLKPDAARAIRRGLLKNKQEIETRVKVDAIVRQAASALRATSRAVTRWPLASDGFDAIAPGFKTRYKRGQEAMATARKQSSPEAFHEWRKRVKDHWYHVRLLESLWTEVLQARESALKELETWLGDDHNLFVLCGKLKDDPERYGGEENSQFFTGLMEEYSQELREKALSLGERIYEQKPKLLMREMSRLWDAWQNEPASMQQDEQQEVAQKKGPGQAQGKTKRAVA